MKALDAASVAAIEAQLKAAASGDISIEDALAAANAAAMAPAPASGHPWLHPRKGWRNNTKSGGKANRRRKLKPGFLAKAMELRPVRQRSEVVGFDIETRADL